MLHSKHLLDQLMRSIFAHPDVKTLEGGRTEGWRQEKERKGGGGGGGGGGGRLEGRVGGKGRLEAGGGGGGEGMSEAG